MAGEDVREQSDRQREDPHQVREHLEPEYHDGHAAFDAPRDESFQIADRALGAHAFDRVGEEHEQREHERDREVRRGGVQREGGDLGPEDRDLVLRVRRQRQVADEVREEDEEEQRADEREPPRGHLGVHGAAGDVVAHELVEGLDRRLHLVGPLLHAPRDPDHRDRREAGRDEQVHDGLVDREHAQVDPVVELELVLRFEGFVAGAVEPVDDDQRDQADDVDRQHDQQPPFDGGSPGCAPLGGAHQIPRVQAPAECRSALMRLSAVPARASRRRGRAGCRA